MNSKVFFIILLILAGVIIFGLTTKPKQKLSATTPARTEFSDQTPKIASQTKTMGAVEVTIIPITIMAGQDIVFKLFMNTHSVELNYDLTKIATLTDGQGNAYKPIQWTGGNSGHHISGQLIFSALSNKPKQLTLTLEGVDNKTEKFSWEL